MERVQSMRSILLIDDGNDTSPDRDKIRMGNIETATVGHSNRKRLKRRTQPVPNWFQIQHNELISRASHNVNNANGESAHADSPFHIRRSRRLSESGLHFSLVHERFA